MNRRAFLALTGTLALVGGAAHASTKPDIRDIVASTPELSIFLAALTAAGLAETLKGPGPFTVFAPTDAAFAKLPAGALDALLLPQNKDKLVAVVNNHVLGRYATYLSMIEKTQDLPTLGGRMIRTTGKMAVTVNGARIQQPELLASNGVVHRIDTVLMPKL